MEPVRRGHNYLGNWTETLYDEFERAAIYKGVNSDFPDTYPFFLLAAATSLVMSFDELTDFNYEPLSVDYIEEYIENIKVYNLGNKGYFDSLWKGSMWRLIPHDWYKSPFYESYYLEYEYQFSYTQHLTKIDNWYESSELVSEFTSRVRWLIEYKDQGGPYRSNLTCIAQYIGQILFMCKDILREFPDYANYIRKVSFAIDYDRAAFAKRVTHAIREISDCY